MSAAFVSGLPHAAFCQFFLGQPAGAFKVEIRPLVAARKPWKTSLLPFRRPRVSAGTSRPTEPFSIGCTRSSPSRSPKNIFWCDGSEAENDYLLGEAGRQGVLIKLNQEKDPGCYLHRSNPNDVARVEQFTLICTPTKEEAGPTNNWAEPAATYSKLHGMLKGAMRGRTMFVVPYIMGPPDSPLAKIGFEITDSIYVVLSMRIMTRMGTQASERLGEKMDAEFNRGVHSLLDVNPERRFICHFPQDNTIISVGSGYGGNVLLGKKCLALRIASYLAKKQGWLAEHMLILGVESPEGKKHYVAAAFPSACGKTNFAMLIPPAHFAGWKITTIGDDIAWMQIGNGRPALRGQSRERIFRRRARDELQVEPERDARDRARHDLHERRPDRMTATSGGKEKMASRRREAIDWKGNPWTPGFEGKSGASQQPVRRPDAQQSRARSGGGEPGRASRSARSFSADAAATRCRSFSRPMNWRHGVYLGATMGSETTAAATGAVGQVRRDPMAMLPFCGYNMGDYFRHWLETGPRLTNPPLIFHVNWFRKDAAGKFLWPGFGDNMRVLKWIIDRCEGRGGAGESPIGSIPRAEDLDLDGLEGVSPERMRRIAGGQAGGVGEGAGRPEGVFQTLEPYLPNELLEELQKLGQRLSR